jgi:hypothetical protein
MQLRLDFNGTERAIEILRGLPIEKCREISSKLAQLNIKKL